MTQIAPNLPLVCGSLCLALASLAGLALELFTTDTDLNTPLTRLDNPSSVDSSNAFQVFPASVSTSMPCCCMPVDS